MSVLNVLRRSSERLIIIFFTRRKLTLSCFRAFSSICTLTMRFKGQTDGFWIWWPFNKTKWEFSYLPPRYGFQMIHSHYVYHLHFITSSGLIPVHLWRIYVVDVDTANVELYTIKRHKWIARLLHCIVYIIRKWGPLASLTVNYN